MKTKHTQGEWVSTFTSNKSRGVRTENGFICFLPIPIHYPNQDERYESELEENKNNANLIAAAPDLLEALQDIVKQYEATKFPISPDLADSILIFGKNAIKKATE